MNSRQGGTTITSVDYNRVYEDIEPQFEWVKEEAGLETLRVFLSGFQHERLKIQITSSGKLRISGEHQVSQNKWRRFLKDFDLDRDCDIKKISAKFEGGILYVKVPKPITVTVNATPTVNDKPSSSSEGFHKKISPRTVVNSALAVLFVGVLVLYVRNAFTSSGPENNS